jgi:hypothetical protein
LDEVVLKRTERWLCWALSLVWCGFLVWMSFSRGALGIPRNDDWSYLRVTLDLADSGQVLLTGWVQMFFLGQAFLAQPVIAATGGSIAALQLLVAFLGAASLVLTYDLIRRLLPPVLAVLVVLLLAVGPIFGSLAVSFMTDIPALFLTLATLRIGASALQAAGRRQLLLLSAASLVGLLAFTIREYGLLAWIAVALTQLWQCRGRHVPTVVLLTVSLVAACGLWAWRAQIPGTLPTQVAVPDGAAGMAAAASLLCAAMVTLGVLIAPALLVINPRRLIRRGRIRHAVLVVGAVLLIAQGARSRFPLGNMLTASGSYPGTVIGSWEIPLIPGWAMLALAAIGLAGLLVSGLVLTAPVEGAAGGAELVPEEAQRITAGTMRLLVVYLLLTAALLTAFAVLLDQLWDRYLIAAVPISAGLVLAVARQRGLVIRPRFALVPVVGIAAYALFGLAFVDRAATIDGATWAVAEAAVSPDLRPQSIDAGFAWNGTWQPGPATWPAPAVPGQPWWRSLYPEAVFCAQVQVSATPPTDDSVVVAHQAPTLLGSPLWFTVVDIPASDTLPQC